MGRKDIKGTSEQLKRLAEWVATPKPLRKPKTLGELAAQFGISRRTLFTWRRLPQVAKMVQEAMKGRGEGAQRVLTTLRELGEQGNVSAGRTYLTFIGEFGRGKAAGCPHGFKEGCPYEELQEVVVALTDGQLKKLLEMVDEE